MLNKDQLKAMITKLVFFFKLQPQAYNKACLKTCTLTKIRFFRLSW